MMVYDGYEYCYDWLCGDKSFVVWTWFVVIRYQDHCVHVYSCPFNDFIPWFQEQECSLPILFNAWPETLAYQGHQTRTQYPRYNTSNHIQKVMVKILFFIHFCLFCFLPPIMYKLIFVGSPFGKKESFLMHQLIVIAVAASPPSNAMLNARA